jgi:hypothetical protein
VATIFILSQSLIEETAVEEPTEDLFYIRARYSLHHQNASPPDNDIAGQKQYRICHRGLSL